MNKSNFALLQTHILKERAHFVPTHDQFEPVHLDSAAMSVFTDFYKEPPFTTTKHAKAFAALQQMKLSKVKSLFVVNEDDEVLGYICARDIQGAKFARVAQQNDIKQPEITVKMMMTWTEEMHTLQFSELSNARVGHIVRLLSELQTNYIFVVEGDVEAAKIRGMFSISRISLQLGEAVIANLSSHSVAEINHII